MFFSKLSKYFKVKPSPKYLLHRGKDLLVLPYTYILSYKYCAPPTTPATLSEMWTHGFKNVGEK